MLPLLRSAVALGVALSCAAAACSSDKPAAQSPVTTAASTTDAPRSSATTVAPVTSTTARPTPTTIPTGPFEVSTASRTYLDRTRNRPLVTTLHIPNTPGPLPLFVWVHGMGSTPEFFDPYLERIAERGVLVAAPRMPRSSSYAADPDFDDYANQPRDITYLLDRMLAEFGPRIDPKRTAVGGHSLGAMTTVGLVADRCCLDARVKAAVEVDGTRPSFPSGAPIAHKVPTLWIHGDADTRFPVRESSDMFEAAVAPKFLVVLRGIQHTPWRVPAAVPVVQSAIEEFLDEFLIGRPGAADALRGAGSGIATFRSE